MPYSSQGEAARRKRHAAAVVCLPLALPALAAAQAKPPAAPALPAGAPSALPALSAPTPSQQAPAAAPTASSGAPPVSPPVDARYVLYGTDKKKGDADSAEGVPQTLPPELRKNVKPGSGVGIGDSRGGSLTIEEIVNTPVVSATNRLEGALSAPALVVVLTAKDLRDRGYTELSQILDDLPGMDVMRPYGDIYVKSYWRGYRPGTGADPYLVMVDGMVFNHLFFGDTQILAAFPLTNIERVEVVYGPASAVYGANAAMGVINVITRNGKAKQAAGELGTWLESRSTFGGAQGNFSAWRDFTRQVDATLLHVSRDYRVRLTARVEDGVLDRSIGERFEYTKNKYYRDERLWPRELLDKYPELAGSFRSPDNKRAVDARFYAGGAELGAQMFVLQTGLGTKYPADRMQTQPLWTTTELNVFGRHTADLSAGAQLTSLIQYRQSGISSPSINLSTTRLAELNARPAGVELSALEVPGSALILQQDLSLTAGRSLFMERDALSIGAGLKYQRLNLSRDYRVVSATVYPGTSPGPFGAPVDVTSPGDPSSDGRLRIDVDHVGAYALAKYEFPPANAVHLGARYDRLTLGDVSDVTIRGGYAGTFDPLTVKLLYGQALYSPGAFDLAQAERASGQQLEVERSQTLETNVALTVASLALFADAYYVTYSHPIISGSNLAARQVAGLDAGARALFRPVMLWAYYSRFLTAKESREDNPALAPIGDLAFDKVWAGATFDRAPVTLTVLGRWIGARDTVETNPIRSVPSYFTLDANFMLSHVFVEPAWIAFRASNILGTQYFQPGTGLANSGVTPGAFAADGSYRGSGGASNASSFNSLHAQPGRAFYWTLGLDL